MAKIKKEYCDLMARTAQTFYEKGCTSCLDGGDMSIRDPETGYIYIYPRPNEEKGIEIRNWTFLTPSEIAVVDEDGNDLLHNGVLPTVEMPMHLAIYKARPDVQVILHTHGMWSSVFAISREDVPNVLPEQAIFLGEVKCAEYGMVGTFDLGEKMVKAVGDRNAALLANHGAVIVAPSVELAFDRHEFLERVCQMIVFSKVYSGKVNTLKEDEIINVETF